MSSGRPEQPRPRGVGLLRLAGWGWGVTIALLLLIALVLLVGWLRNDPGRNPPPTGYAVAVCAAVDELELAVNAVEQGVTAREAGNEAAYRQAVTEVERRVHVASAETAELPPWPPGERFEELLGSLVVTLLEAINAVQPTEKMTPPERVELARGLVTEARATLDDGRLGFGCEARGAPTRHR